MKKIMPFIMAVMMMFTSVINIHAEDILIATYTFYGEDQVTQLSSQKVQVGETVYSPSNPEKDGYVFQGWSTVSNSTVVELESFTSFQVQSITNTEINYYPVFAEQRYVFFHHPNGGVLETYTGVDGDVVNTDSVSIDLSFEYSIEGWYLDTGFTQKVSSVTISGSNIHLYPKVEEGYFITFYRESGSSYIEPQFVKPGEVTQDPGTPVRNGYSFVGWSTAQGSPVADYTFGNPLSGDITLYPVWVEDSTTYIVRIFTQSDQDNKNTPNDQKTYVDNGTYGTFTTLTGTVIDSSTIATELSYTGFTRNTDKDKTYTISGDGTTTIDIYYDRVLVTLKFWRLADDNEGVQYGQVNRNTNASDFFDITLGADGKWYKEDGTVYTGNRYKKDVDISGLFGTSYEANGEEFPMPRESTSTELYRWAHGSLNMRYSVLHTFNVAQYYDSNYTMYLKEYRNTGSVQPAFVHNEQWDGTYITEDYSGPVSGLRASLTSTRGIWAHSYSYDGGNTITYLDQTPDTIAYIPFNYSGTTDIYYRLREFDLEFYNYNEIVKTETVKFSTPILIYTENYAPTRPQGIPNSYEFMGWYMDEDFTIEITDQTLPVNGATVYAKWAEPTYTVTVHKDMNPDGEVDYLSVVYMNAIDKSALFDIVDNQKWATRDESGVFTLFSLNTLITKDVEIYPVIVDDEDLYQVTYDLDGGNGTTPTDSNKYLVYSSAMILSGNNATKDGKPFLKWVYNGISYYPGASIQMVQDVTLTAVYGDIPTSANLTYKANGGDGADYIVNDIANNDVVEVMSLLQTGFTRSGYTFLGWSTTADGEVEYAPGSTILINQNNENILYAIWQENKKPNVPDTSDNKPKTPDTSDSTNGIAWLGLFGSAIVLAGAAWILFIDKKRKNS